MDNEDEKLIHFASGRHYSTFKLKVANLNEDNMSKLRKELFYFSNFYNEYNFLNKLIKEPFYDTYGIYSKIDDLIHRIDLDDVDISQGMRNCLRCWTISMY